MRTTRTETHRRDWKREEDKGRVPSVSDTKKESPLFWEFPNVHYD